MTDKDLDPDELEYRNVREFEKLFEQDILIALEKEKNLIFIK